MSKANPVLAVFGGAFDPYTKHHHAVVSKLLTTGLANRVCIVPADCHKFKNPTEGLSSRAEMIRRHLEQDELVSSEDAFLDVEVSAYQRGADTMSEYMGSSLELLRAAKAKYPGYDVAMVIGEDCLGTITTWHRYRELRKEGRFLVLPRRGYAAFKKPRGLNVTMVPDFDSKGSSTEARRALIRKDYLGASRLMCDESAEYAYREGLYNAPLSTGGPTLLADCTNYDDSGFKKALSTVDTAIVRMRDSKLEVLLVKRRWHPYQGKWALPGGFMDLDKGETLEEASLRELEEETGAVGVPVQQLRTYGDPERDPRGRVLTVAFYALVPGHAMDSQKLEAMDDAGGFQWRHLHEGMRADDLAFDHAVILLDLLKQVRMLTKYTPLAFELVDKGGFTRKELECAYEALLGKRTGNLMRKVSMRYNVTPTGVGAARTRLRGRPANLFRYLGEKDPF